MKRPVVLAAGGTGGHMFPAEALGAELTARGRKIVLVTDKRGVAFGADHAAFWRGVETYAVRSATPAGRGAGGFVRAAFETALGAAEASRLLRRLEPAAVVGFGGYPSLPTMLAAVRRRLPSAIHEQNAVLGRVNRVLARWVSAVALAQPETRGVPRYAAQKATQTGNPVRAAVKQLRGTPYPHLDARVPFRLLVIGGSQGAQVFSLVVPAALAALPVATRRRLTVTQQCRAEDLEAVRAQYREAGVAADLATFFTDLPRRLGEAHLVIARAGASSVSELACAGRPALLVPLPYAADDHQAANAHGLVRAGGAIAMVQAAFTPAALTAALADLLADPARLVTMAERARTAGVVDAETRLADLVERLAPAAAADARCHGAEQAA
jgi:UDP-N-acetylglucosamine--N-acetylmuramyl-(pentapeptide) pyrophosphoryl-undecaprenol N-acetylglucosamine transferase